MKTSAIVFVFIIFFLEIYIYQAFKTLVNAPVLRAIYWLITLGTYSFLFYTASNVNRGDVDQHSIQIVTSIFLIFIIPKVFIIMALMVDDVMRFVNLGMNYFSANDNHIPARRKFISRLGLGAAAAFGVMVLDGIIFGKYRFKTRNVKLQLPNLPESFKGYKIVQISDVHSGSFFEPEKLQKAIDLINKQDADLILFTGDMVNNVAEEFEPFVPLFASIKAKDGKFSVLGNHDYGDYHKWSSAEEKAQNIPNLIRLQEQAGFKMLMNEHHIVEKNGEKLYILGVENWGEKPFPQYGDLDKAAEGVPVEATKILMSHDPTHFDVIAKFHPANIHLTLSGHTHGMQFGIDLKNFRWSPVQYRYPKWADLYKSNEKYLYVNRGFGVLGYPGRVGIDPEITVFELI